MKFKPNTPFESRTPTVVVDAGMRPGSYRFRLEVEDEEGHKSRPDERVVVIVGTAIRLDSREVTSPEPGSTDDTDFWPHAG